MLEQDIQNAYSEGYKKCLEDIKRKDSIRFRIYEESGYGKGFIVLERKSRLYSEEEAK